MAANAGTPATNYLDVWKRSFGQVQNTVLTFTEIEGKLNPDAVNSIDESDFACNKSWGKAKRVLNVKKLGKLLKPRTKSMFIKPSAGW